MLTLPGKTSNILTLCLELEKKTEPKVSKIKGIIINRAEISDKEKKKTPNFKRLIKLTWFFKKIKFKNLARQIKEKWVPKSTKL